MNAHTVTGSTCPAPRENLSPEMDYALALFSGKHLGTTVMPKLAYITITNPLVWIAAIESVADMQELSLTNPYAVLLIQLFNDSITQINQLGISEKAARSLIYRLQIGESLKSDGRRQLKYAQYQSESQ